jgi:hypothetical protein
MTSVTVISHRGSLSDADLSYATLGSYATRHEISADEAEWRTEIGWPIFRADGPPEAGAGRPRGGGG